MLTGLVDAYEVYRGGRARCEPSPQCKPLCRVPQATFREGLGRPSLHHKRTLGKVRLVLMREFEDQRELAFP